MGFGMGWGGLAQGVGDIFQGVGARQESKEYSKQAKLRTARALGELTPEAMQKLIGMFFSKYYAQLAPQMMGAQSGLDARFARMGMTHAGVGEQLRAGIPGQFALGAMGQAIGTSLPIAESRASIQERQPISIGPSWWTSGGQALKDIGGGGNMTGGFGTGFK